MSCSAATSAGGHSPQEHHKADECAASPSPRRSAAALRYQAASIRESVASAVGAAFDHPASVRPTSRVDLAEALRKAEVQLAVSQTNESNLTRQLSALRAEVSHLENLLASKSTSTVRRDDILDSLNGVLDKERRMAQAALAETDRVRQVLASERAAVALERATWETTRAAYERHITSQQQAAQVMRNELDTVKKERSALKRSDADLRAQCDQQREADMRHLNAAMETEHVFADLRLRLMEEEHQQQVTLPGLLLDAVVPGAARWTQSDEHEQELRRAHGTLSEKEKAITKMRAEIGRLLANSQILEAEVDEMRTLYQQELQNSSHWRYLHEKSEMERTDLADQLRVLEQENQSLRGELRVCEAGASAGNHGHITRGIACQTMLTMKDIAHREALSARMQSESELHVVERAVLEGNSRALQTQLDALRRIEIPTQVGVDDVSRIEANERQVVESLTVVAELRAENNALRLDLRKKTRLLELAEESRSLVQRRADDLEDLLRLGSSSLTKAHGTSSAAVTPKSVLVSVARDDALIAATNQLREMSQRAERAESTRNNVEQQLADTLAEVERLNGLLSAERHNALAAEADRRACQSLLQESSEALDLEKEVHASMQHELQRHRDRLVAYRRWVVSHLSALRGIARDSGVPERDLATLDIPCIERNIEDEEEALEAGDRMTAHLRSHVARCQQETTWMTTAGLYCAEQLHTLCNAIASSSALSWASTMHFERLLGLPPAASSFPETSDSSLSLGDGKLEADAWRVVQQWWDKATSATVDASQNSRCGGVAGESHATDVSVESAWSPYTGEGPSPRRGEGSPSLSAAPPTPPHHSLDIASVPGTATSAGRALRRSLDSIVLLGAAFESVRHEITHLRASLYDVKSAFLAEMEAREALEAEMEVLSSAGGVAAAVLPSGHDLAL